MSVFAGPVREAHMALHESPARFIAECTDGFRRQHGQEPGESELRSWSRSWPELTSALMRADLGDLHLFLEYALPGSGERVDALLLGVRDGRLVAVVIELKQWSVCTWASATRAEVAGQEYTHPCRQAAGYVRYLQTWLAEPDIDVRAVAFLHAAPSEVIDRLRDVVAGSPGSGDVSLVGRDDLPRLEGVDAARLFRGEHLHVPDDDEVKRFVHARHSPSQSVFDRLSLVLTGKPEFMLVGRQQDAHLHVYNTVKDALPSSRHVIAVTGGPGTGKTVIAVRLLADLPSGRRGDGTPVTPRYLTPSGTLRQQLERAAEAAPETKGLFKQLDNFLGNRVAGGEVLLVDEAQRMKQDRGQLQTLLARAHVAVIFLDQRQIIRPKEGLTVTEVQTEADRLGAKFTHIDLISQFRCAGSQSYQRWLERLLFGHDTAQPWSGTDYDLGVASDPEDLDTWIDEHTSAGRIARVAAGFCWPWSEGTALRDDVTITWTSPDGEERTWRRPWNSRRAHREGNEILVPKKEFWATDPGGHRQVGCIYTSQGLEYDYGGIIMGPDLIRRDGRWIAQPKESHDPAMSHVSPQDYLRYATNTYWVLASRASRGCRLYSTDAETQQFLQSLISDHAHAVATM
ncbi:DNA/RNA helicase domain-containing protein [Saccharopolyspora shandongensis]|uniref:DNA/RNA helicase domain-containing protein n=1 Tax=Saccharopolyspora shandongensis TaxID=418495 RepID=UPI003424603D